MRIAIKYCLACAVVQTSKFVRVTLSFQNTRVLNDIYNIYIILKFVIYIMSGTGIGSFFLKFIYIVCMHVCVYKT